MLNSEWLSQVNNLISSGGPTWEQWRTEAMEGTVQCVRLSGPGWLRYWAVELEAFVVVGYKVVCTSMRAILSP